VAVIHSEAPPIHRPERRNFWFAVGSLLLLGATIWMMYADYHREWKRYQREFRRIEIERAGRKIAELDGQYKNSRDLKRQAADLEAARKDLEARRGDVEQARAAVAEADRKFYLAESEWKISKSYYDAHKYEYEEAKERGRGEAGAEREFKESEARYLEAVAVREVVEKEQSDAKARVRALTGKVEEIERKIASLTEMKSRLEKKIEAIGPSLANAVRDRPVVDFMNPSIRVQQVLLPNLHNDVNFLKVGKVDRCVTCHLAAAEKGYEDLPQPFKAHSDLDLFLSPASKHPYEQFGCTTCHQGLDRATYFVSAMHMPGSAEQRHRWEHEHGWAEPHYWDAPMLPTEHTEAACLKCHRREARIPGAARLNRALEQLERAGCQGCHRIQGFEDLRKAGPDLARVASKTTFDWAYAWVADPRTYRPTTWMPRFFYVSNSNSPEDQARNRVEIDAILAYIFGKSQPFEAAPPPVKGDPVRGRQVVQERGCLGCHHVGENPERRGAYGREFGPALDRVGDKVSEAWLYNWIKDPRRYFPDTYMPDLRLTDQEAADAAAFLMTLKGAPPAPAPPPEPAVLDAVTLEYLKARLTDAEARTKLAGMSAAEKRVFLGENLINRYGCFGCHNIPGFEKALPIGTELTQEGSKLVTRLDFGYVEIEHTRQDWFFQKLKDPRIFDHGKVKTPQERLKMPDFGFTDEEASVMVTLLLGLTKDEPLLETVNTLDPREAAVEAGRRLIARHNCRGCHVIEGEGGAIRATIQDQGYHPPVLAGEGAKVQSRWLFDFLKEPEPIRPWLTVHMPTFGFTDEEAGKVAGYFAAHDRVLYPFESGPAGEIAPARLAQGKELFTQLKCLQCHQLSGASGAGLSASDLAPDLSMARRRLRHDWIVEWLKDPQKLQPGTRMPSFFYSDGDPLMEEPDAKMTAIRDYLLTLGGPEPRRGRSLMAAGSARDGRSGL
jgi:cbb3-type cytochrome oxidase cytochrome c subunit